MKLYTLNINDAEFRVGLITDKAVMKKGLSGKPLLGRKKGLLFDFGKEQTITMNMRGMKYALDMIFINMSKEVIAVRSLEPGNYQTTVKKARFVLEVKKGEGAGLVGEKICCTEDLAMAVGMIPCKDSNKEEDKESNINHHKRKEAGYEGVNIIVKVSTAPKHAEEIFKKGGAFKIYEDEVKAEKNTMQVLDDTGKVLMNIKGGERIFSIEHTEQLVAMAKRIETGDASEEDLGKLMNKIINIQNTQAPEYVE